MLEFLMTSQEMSSNFIYQSLQQDHEQPSVEGKNYDPAALYAATQKKFFRMSILCLLSTIAFNTFLYIKYYHYQLTCVERSPYGM